jgi:hypothetical protein
MQKILKGFYEVKCQNVDHAMSEELNDCFPLATEPILNVELLVEKFVKVSLRIRC